MSVNQDCIVPCMSLDSLLYEENEEVEYVHLLPNFLHASAKHDSNQLIFGTGSISFSTADSGRLCTNVVALFLLH